MFNQTHLNNSGSARQTPTHISGWGSAYYAYDPAHPHAVATIERSAGPDHFAYDTIGDMTTRNEAGVSWTQGFNEEGRLETISDSTGTWTFTYDGDGNRVVQANPDGTTTLFLGGGAYEVHLSAVGQETLVRRYRAASLKRSGRDEGLAGQQVMLDGTDTYYLLTDHLGSVCECGYDSIKPL